MAEIARTTPSGDEDRKGKKRRLWIIIGGAVVLGVVAGAPRFVSDHYADELANDLEAELAVSAARIPDQALADLSTQQILASYNGSEPGPLLEALGQRRASGIVWGKGEGTVSLSFKVSWGIADRCVHLLLRPGQPALTDTAASTSCQARVP